MGKYPKFKFEGKGSLKANAERKALGRKKKYHRSLVFKSVSFTPIVPMRHVATQTATATLSNVLLWIAAKHSTVICLSIIYTRIDKLQHDELVVNSGNLAAVLIYL